MNPILKNVLALLAGLVVGSIVNWVLVYLGGMMIPVPEGVDNSTMEGLKEGMKLFEPKHFLSPFIGHAVGTLAGAYIAARLAANNAKGLALIIGLFFLIMGTLMVMQLPSPMWFNVLDLVVAYIPMAWLGYSLASKNAAASS